MKPGKELDKLIAEKVFGLVGCDGWEPISFGSAGGWMLKKVCGHDNNKCWPKQTLDAMNGEVGGAPKYSTMFSHTQTLLDHMLKNLPQQDIHVEHLEGFGWQVSTCHEDDGWHGWVRGETIEHAICLAALKMFNVE